MSVDRTELELVWPAELFRQEGQVLLDAGEEDETTLGWLLSEAFHGERGYQLFTQTPVPFKGWPTDVLTAARAQALLPQEPPQEPSPRVRLVTALVRDADQLPRHIPRRYYSARRDPRAEAPLTLAQTKTGYARVVADLAGTGYFQDGFGSSCVDDGDDPAEQGKKQLSSLLDTDRPMWPLAGADGKLTGLEQDWSQDLFFDVIEALHDLVARPRWRGWHDYAQEWDYANFARTPGQAVYRWKVNELLARSQIPLHLANSGSDRGQMVHAAGDDRDALVEQALQTPNPTDQDAVRHAIALFRHRAANRENKRSAVLALHRVLEDRRSLIKAELVSKDEGALFQIANEFDLRHSGARQRTDYQDAYLDWVFWWYLATLELTDRIVASQVDRP